MGTMQWRPEVNALTTPQSYWPRFMPRGSAGREDIAADIASRHPNFSKDDILTILNAEDEAVLTRLLDGDQVTKEGCCTWYPSFTGRLDSPDDPLPPLAECLQVNVRVSAPFVERLRQAAQTERLPLSEKLPVIASAEDTVLGLRDVLRQDGMLRLTGSNLLFDRSDSVSQCVIEGTRSGSAVQRRIGTVTNTELVLMPDVPGQNDTWNNEYRISLTTRYTENGTPRTGVYKRLLRTPIAVRLGDGQGILSSSGTVPLVRVTGGWLTAQQVSARVEAVRDIQDGSLRFRLLDMQEDGLAGGEARLSANGVCELSGWAGSLVGSLELTVADYGSLLALVKNVYGGRLVDVLDISAAA